MLRYKEIFHEIEVREASPGSRWALIESATPVMDDLGGVMSFDGWMNGWTSAGAGAQCHGDKALAHRGLQRCDRAGPFARDRLDCGRRQVKTLPSWLIQTWLHLDAAFLSRRQMGQIAQLLARLMGGA